MIKRIGILIGFAVTLFALPVNAQSIQKENVERHMERSEIRAVPKGGVELYSDYSAYVGLNGNRYGASAYMRSTPSSYRISAKCDRNTGTSVGTTGWYTNENTTYVSTTNISANSWPCTFIAYGESLRIKGGNVYTGQMSRTYN